MNQFISEKIADRILDIAAINYSGNVLIHALAWNKHSYEHILMDESFVVVQRTQYESSNIPLLSLLENEIVLSTDYFHEKNLKSEMLSIHNKESKEILHIQGKISTLDASCINNRRIIAFTNDENTDIHFLIQGFKNEWIEWSHSPIQYNLDGVLGDFIANFSGTSKNLWTSIALTTKGNIIRLCAVKLNDIYYMEGCLIDNEIRILWENHYPVKYMIYCTEFLDDRIVVGDEEGVVHFIYIGDKALYTTDNIISTEIGVLSNHHVDLSTAVFENGEKSLSRLNGYFKLPE